MEVMSNICLAVIGICLIQIIRDSRDIKKYKQMKKARKM